jgi:hypothetical protein
VRFFWFLQVGVVLLAPPAFYSWRYRGDRERALKGGAFVLASLYAAFFRLFAVGETFTDPGGWVAVGATSAWLIPLVALSLMASHRPRWAATALGALLLALGGVYLWSVAAPEAWTTFEDSNGPIRALIAFTLALPLAVLGWRQPRVAGAMLIALPPLPTVMLLISVARGLGAEGWPIAIVTAPAGIIGALYLMAGSPHPTPGQLTHSGPAGEGG